MLRPAAFSECCYHRFDSRRLLVSKNVFMNKQASKNNKRSTEIVTSFSSICDTDGRKWFHSRGITLGGHNQNVKFHPKQKK